MTEQQIMEMFLSGSISFETFKKLMTRYGYRIKDNGNGKNVQKGG